MRRKVSILARGVILTFLLTLLLGSLVVHAEEEQEVRINYTKYTVNVGDADNVLQLKIENQKEGDKKPRWVSYNVNVASVDQNGVVTPLRKGKTVISSGFGFPRKTCTVTVVDPSVKLNKAAATIYRSDKENTPGNTITLTAKVNGATKKATDIAWSSSNERVAKVVPDNKGRGVVTSADQAGTAVITAKVNGKAASCKVTVLESTISLNVDEMQLSTSGAGSSIKLVPTVVGKSKKVTWKSSDTKTATVSGGKVTGKKEGTVTVTATANGIETTCAVKVAGRQISIGEEKVLLYVTKTVSAGEDGETTEEITGETKELKTNAAKTDVVTWTSSDENVVTVAGQDKGKTKVGKITAVGAGTATITVECNGKTDTCVVEVKNTSTSIAEKIVYLKNKGTASKYTLGYQVIGRKNKVTWASSDTKVVTVNKKGLLTGKKAGEATVTMTANGVTDTVKITVQDYTPTIALNQKEYTLYTKGTGNSVTLKATINGASKDVAWESNDPEIAEVSTKGRVTAKGKEGQALITATANGVTAKCWVNVKEPKIILEKNALTVEIGSKNKVNLPDYASIEVTGAKQSVTYKSSATKIAAVDKKGNVTGKKAGEATITITANGVTETCAVTVLASLCEEHTFGETETVREASCEESGLISKTCTTCGFIEQKVTDPLGHSFGKWSVYVWSTENAAGLERQVCTRCNAKNTRTIPAKNKGEVAQGYKLVWEDDFNGTELDRDSWNVELHDSGWVNSELQEYVDSPDNIYVQGGNLVIQAIKDGNNYTSGRINTQNMHDYQYGRFEARAKVPSGKGFLPAFWMMPTDESFYGQWPKCGEIDVMEVMGQETNKLYSTLHFGEPHTEKQGTHTLAEGPDFAEDFHVYACEWDPDEFRFYVDDQLFYTVNDWFSKQNGFPERAYPAPYNQPFYMILNLAVGGSWVGNPNEDTQFGDNAQLVVDYVRVYQKDEYDTNVSRTETKVDLRDPDETGNYIINGDFAKVEDLAKGDGNWQLLLAQGGAAAAENTDGILNITQTAAGEVNHSVQIVQAGLPIEKGSSYKLSYEAYADAERTVITNVTAPDRGYARYLADTTVTLTAEKQKFEHPFDMTSNSDANGRVEFNLGNQGSTAAIHIDNVRLEKTGAAEEEAKNVLPDGNYVYNGSFSEGGVPGRLRLDYWDWNVNKCTGTSISVTEDSRHELRVIVPAKVTALDDVVVNQTDIAIEGGKKYVLSFDARADQEKTIKSTIAGETFESKLTTKTQAYEYKFKTEDDLNGSELRFLLGTAGTTYIDNVCVREDKLIVNGDFSNGLTGFEVYVDSSASVPSYIVDSMNGNDNAFSIDIADTGDKDWKIQLKQNNVKLQKGREYKISFDAKSTKPRKIMYALQRDGSGDNDWTPYSGSQVIDLTTEYKTFEHEFEMTYDTDLETILSISMGAVGGTQIKDKHTVVIDNIALEDLSPEEEPPVVEGENMIKNGDFAAGGDNWVKYIEPPAAADVSFADGKAVYEITNVGEKDHQVQLQQTGLKLEKGAKYEVKFKIKSSKARTVKFVFQDPENDYDWYGGKDVELEADTDTEVTYTLDVNKATCETIAFVISMGKIEGKDTPSSTIEIDDVSVVKVGGTGGTGDEQAGENLIKNGNFADWDENWYTGFLATAEGKADLTHGKARYEIIGAGGDDWNIQLKQEGLTMEKGAYYKVNFKIGSSIDRDVKLAFMGAGDKWCGGADIHLTKDKFKSYSTIVDFGYQYESGTVAFQLSMGQIGTTPLEPHAIEISDISVTKVDTGATADEVTETAVTIAPPAENLIKNGDFTEGENDWYASYIADAATASKSFENNKARYEITNAGTADWNVQLKQEGLNMEKGAYYKVNFKIGSSIDRDVKLAFMGAGDKWCGGADIHLTKDKLKSYSTIVDFGYQYESGTVAFQLSMGQIGTTTLTPHAIEISDISVTKVDAGTKADAETEKDYMITPPSTSRSESEAKTTLSTNDSDDKVGDDSGDAVEDDDQNTDDSDDNTDDKSDEDKSDEDSGDKSDDNADDKSDDDSDDTSDDKSDDAADDEEADQEKSDGQKDNGDTETSDGQSGSGSGGAQETSDESGNDQTSKDAGGSGMKQTSGNQETARN